MTPSTPDPPPQVVEWLRGRSFPAGPVDAAAVIEAKRGSGHRVSVCLPALNEAATIGAICASLAGHVSQGLIDELIVVVDSRSTDETEAVARAAGAMVFRSADLVPEVPVGGGGKGDVLWRSLAAATGDLVVWIDADLSPFDAGFVPRLLLPLLQEEDVVFVKGHYARRGGRVTELVARPLLGAFYPELTGFIQPLAGEMAGRRAALLETPFFTGYGVEIGLLIDLLQRFGLSSLAQADLLERHHRPRELAALGSAAHDILEVVLRRVEDEGRAKFEGSRQPVLFRPANGGLEAVGRPIEERPPLASIL